MEGTMRPKEIPQDLLKTMQEPLIMRWWTIVVLACKAQRYLPFCLKMTKGVRNMTMTKEIEIATALNLLLLPLPIGLLPI
jgi:hypothetical protein